MSHPLIAEPIEIDIDDLITEDDTPVDNWYSEKQQRLLTETLYSSWQPPVDEMETPRKFTATAKVGLFLERKNNPMVPDMLLSLDVETPDDLTQRKNRSYFVWEIGKVPEVVVEIVSNREGGEDTTKLRAYARMGIYYYVIHDPFRELSQDALRVYELGFHRYRLRPDDRLPEIGLSLTLWEGEYEGSRTKWLRWCDAAGNLIPTGAERADNARQRAQNAEQRAGNAEQRAAALAAKLRDLGFDPDKLS
ncbi:MAG: Uma2 family endonuclease [Blastocatellia bacterium]